MSSPQAESFYDVQRQKWRTSILLTSVLFIFHIALLYALTLICLLIAGLLGGGPGFFSSIALKALIVAAVLALALAVFQYLDARKNGAAFILRHLDGRPPDVRDRYHKQFVDVVDEIRTAAGLPRVKSYVLPTLAINCLALIEADGTPAVAVTEGLLSEGTRDEIQAAVAHEVAHIVRGDTVFITLACSLAAVFERFAESLQPDVSTPPAPGQDRFPLQRGSFFLGLAARFSSVLMRLLSTLISRQREILADAAAVELCRAPEALARVLYKAKLKNAFVGDFSLTYSPLFIVSADPLSENEGLWGRLFSTHPPLMDRVERLAGMAHKSGAAIIEQVWDIQKNRREHQRRLMSEEEYQKLRQPASASEPDKAWLIPDDKGHWIGPLSIEELFRNPYFVMSRRVKNIRQGIEAAARDFPAIRDALRGENQKRPSPGQGRNLCPRCRSPLSAHFYEGVAIKVCKNCLGKLVDDEAVDRILARREFSFTPDLMRKAEEFKRQFLTNPIKAQKVKDQESAPVYCPECGYRMASRPYNYQYFLPVEKCLSCFRVWFDADELEILQILIERA